MTPTSLSTDPKVIDQRSRYARDATSDDQTSADQSFGGMLSTLQGDNAPPVASTGGVAAPDPKTNPVAVPAGKPSTALAVSNALSLVWSAVAADAPLNQTGQTSVGVIIDKITDAAALTVMGPGKTATKDDGPSDPTPDAPAAPGMTPSALDLFSLLGISAQRNAPAQQPSASAPSVEGVTTTGAKAPEAGPTLPDDTQADPEVTIATEIASFSHLAPAPILTGTPTPQTGKNDPVKGSTPGKSSPKQGDQDVTALAAVDTQGAIPDAHSAVTAVPSAADPSKSVTAIIGKADARATAPAGTASVQAPIQAVIDAVTQLASSPTQNGTPVAAATTNTVSANAPSGTIASLAPARTMTLQLMPAELGTVNVRLHLVGGSLDVSLGVSDQQTLGLLTREQTTLSEALNGQTYQLNSLVIQGTDAPATTPGGNNASANHTGGNAASNQQSGGFGARDGDGSARRQSAARQEVASHPASPTGNQLFV